MANGSQIGQAEGHGITGNAEWTGVSLAHLLDKAGVRYSERLRYLWYQ